MLYGVLALAALSCALLVPGHLLARASRLDDDPLGQLALALGLGLAAVSAAVFVAGVLARTWVSARLVLAAAAAVALLALRAAGRWRPRRLRSFAWPAAATLMLVALFANGFAPEYLFIGSFWSVAPGDRDTFWETCIHRAAYCALQPEAGLQSQPDFARDTLYVGLAPGSLPENFLVGGGVAIHDHQLGNTAVISTVAALAQGLGFRLTYALVRALVVLLGYLLARRLWGGMALPLASALLLGANAFVSAMYTINENTIALMLAALLLYLAASPWGRRRWLPAGLVLGLLGGVRYVAVLLWLPLLWWVGRERDPWRSLALLLAGAVMASMPWFYYNELAFGSALTTPSLHDFAPVEHRLLGVPFEYNGYLNWPFIEHAVRTPHQPFPTFLLLPLSVAWTFGAALTAAGLVGAIRLWRERRGLAVLLALWLVPVLALLSVHENWNQEKTYYLLLVYEPIVLAIVAGLDGLWREPGRELPRAAAIAVAVLVLSRAAAGLEFPPDARWYDAREEADFRTSHLREVAETQEELAAIRRDAASVPLLPSPPRLGLAPSPELAEELGDLAAGRRLFDDPCDRILLELERFAAVMDADRPELSARVGVAVAATPTPAGVQVLPVPHSGSSPGGVAIDLTGLPAGPCTVLDAAVERRGRSLEVRFDPLPPGSCSAVCARPEGAGPGRRRALTLVVPPGAYRVRVLVSGELAREEEVVVP